MSFKIDNSSDNTDNNSCKSLMYISKKRGRTKIKSTNLNYINTIKKIDKNKRNINNFHCKSHINTKERVNNFNRKFDNYFNDKDIEKVSESDQYTSFVDGYTNYLIYFLLLKM